MTEQLQLPAPIPGAINATASHTAKTSALAWDGTGMDPDWAAAFTRAITVMANRGVPFQASDLIREGLIDEPASPAWWGVAFSRAAHDGVIRHAGVVESARVTTKRSLCREWIGAHPQEPAT